MLFPSSHSVFTSLLLSLRHYPFRQNFFIFSHFSHFALSCEVRNALNEGKGVVALESTVLTHGLPYPSNLNVGVRLEQIVRESGAIPATIAILDGHICVGLSQHEIERLSEPGSKPMKVSRREMTNCLAEKKVGGTTVAATMWIAHNAGIRVFATGGIGGVHRNGQNTLDISADLTELGRTPVAVVCAGAKSILDIGRTLEYLETQSVNVIVYNGHDQLIGQKNAQPTAVSAPSFPGFFSPNSPFPAPYHTDSLNQIAQILLLSTELGLSSGTLIACPLPAKHHATSELIEKATDEALAEANRKGIQGKGLTPFLLDKIHWLSGSASVEANIALLENNARIGAQLAVLFAKQISNKKSTSKISMDSNMIKTCSAKMMKKEKPPKIVCVGASIVDVQVFLNSDGLDQHHRATYLPARIVHSAGGVARNHADALSRLGCEVTLLSALGTENGDQLDVFGQFLVDKTRGINWSHVLRCSEASTASSVGIFHNGVNSSALSQGFISVEQIIERMDEKYIESKAEQISSADFVLMDANLGVGTMRKLIELAEQNNVNVWFEPTNVGKVPKLFEAFGPKAIHKLTALSPNLIELDALAKHLEDSDCLKFVKELKDNLKASKPSTITEWISQIRVPSALFPRSLRYLVITCDSNGVLIFCRPSVNQQQIVANFVPPPNIRPEQIVSVSGAGDCFNCGFLRAQLTGVGLVESLEFGRKCAELSLRSAQVVPDGISAVYL